MASPGAPTTATERAMSRATSGFSYLVALQVGSRVMTFLLNALIAKRVGPSVYGVASVQFHLLLNSVLFLAREGSRRACLRSAEGGQGGQARQDVVNLVWLTVPLSALLCGVLCTWILRGGGGGGEHSATYGPAVLLIGAASLVEMLSEPVYVLLSAELAIRARVAVELCGVVARSVVTYLLVCVVQYDRYLSFALGQLGFAVCATAGYYLHVALRGARPAVATESFHGLADVLPSWRSGWRVNAELRGLAAQFTLQSVEKFVLTEGEKLVLLGRLAADQGVYGLVSNLGSLVARMALQPLEEAGFLLFGRLSAAGETAAAVRILGVLVRLVVLLGGVFVAFGPNYSFVFIDTVYGAQWSGTEAPVALSWYCLYVLVISVNGICEAFVHATARTDQLAWFNKLFVPLAGVYLACAVVAVNTLGVSGLIAANCVNMGGRIAMSASYIRPLARAEKVPMHHISPWPTPVVLAAYGLCYAATAYSDHVDARAGGWATAADKARHLAVGCGCFALLGTTILAKEKTLIADLRWVRDLRRSGGVTTPPKKSD